MSAELTKVKSDHDRLARQAAAMRAWIKEAVDMANSENTSLNGLTHGAAHVLQPDAGGDFVLAEEVAKLREQHNMELAGISTASIQNTPSSIKGRITRDNPYWTVAYGDVCVAVDREMKLRAELEAAKKELADLKESWRREREIAGRLAERDGV